MAQRTPHHVTRGEKVLLFWLTIFVAAVVGYLWWWTEINTNPVVAVTPPVMPSPNAFDLLQDAWAKHTPGGLSSDYRMLSVPPKYRKLPPIAVLQAHVTAETVVFQQIRGSFQYDYQEPPPYSKSYFIDQYYNLRELGRMLYSASAIQRLSGKTGTALDMCLDGTELKTLTQQNAGLIGVMSSASIAKTTRQAGWELVDHLSAEDATRGAQRLLALIRRQPEYADVLTIEKTYGQQQRVATFQQLGWRTENVRCLGGPQLKLAVLCCSKRDVMRKYNIYMDAWISLAKHPYSVSTSYPKAPHIIILVPIQTTVVPDQKNYLIFIRSRTQDHLLLAALALRAYYNTHGRYPAALSALSPAFVKTLPGDPFNSGKPLRYRLTGKRYMLYSVGPDGKDDRGIADKDIVAGVNMR